MTMVDRATSCIVGWCVGYERTEAVMQALVDAAPQAVLYYSDDFFDLLGPDLQTRSAHCHAGQKPDLSRRR